MLYSNNTNTNISGGNINSLSAYENSIMFLSGGSISEILAYYTSNITITGKDFSIGNGLELIDGKLFGTGTLSGKWIDGTGWSTEIVANDPTATILLIPEPCALLLLGIGGLLIRKQTF